MEKSKLGKRGQTGLSRVKVTVRKPLRTYSGEILPAGSEITLTDEWETAPFSVRGRVILNPNGERRLVTEQELDYALGAH